MSLPASTWISVALGAVMGALVGFYDASHAEEAPRHASRGTAAAPISSTRQVAAPVFVQVRSAAPRAEAEPPEPPAHVTAPEQSTELTAQATETPPRAAQPASKQPTKRVTLRPNRAPRASDTRRNVELADAKAVFRAESACARQDPEQCLRASRAFSIGVAIPPNPKSAEIYWHNALRLYERGCKRLEPLSCVGLGAMYESGAGQQRNYASEVLQRARGICKDRRQNPCNDLDDEADKLRAIVRMPDAPSAPSAR